MNGREISRRLAAIRRLARVVPGKDAAKQLGLVAAVASGEGDVEGVFKANVQDNLAERLAAGVASRSPSGAGHADPPEEKKREKKAGRNRKERTGRDRGGE